MFNFEGIRQTFVFLKDQTVWIMRNYRTHHMMKRISIMLLYMHIGQLVLGIATHIPSMTIRPYAQLCQYPWEPACILLL